MTGAAPPYRGRRDNGLVSERFAAIADIDPRLSDHLLDVLGLREVPAYVEPSPATNPAPLDRLHVAADQADAGREVLEALAAELGISISYSAHTLRPEPTVDPLEGIDTDAEFEAIVAGLGDLGRPLIQSGAAEPVDNGDTEPPGPADPTEPRGPKPSETDALLEAEHFVPPAPPPVPRPAAPTVIALIVTLLGIGVIAFGGMLGMPSDFPLPAGVILILTGVVLLILRLRPEPRDESSDGDGAVV
jgi:hypothetical protein